MSGTATTGLWATQDVGVATASLNTLIARASDNLYEIKFETSNETETIKFNFDDSSEHFISKKINTNPQLKASQTFYPTSVEKNYFLGETYEQLLRD